MQRNAYTSLPPLHQWSTQQTFSFTMTLTSPSNEVMCTENVNFSVSASQIQHDFHTFSNSVQFTQCGPINEQGEWRVALRDMNVDNPFVYNLIFYVSPSVRAMGPYITKLWKLRDYMILQQRDSQPEHKNEYSIDALSLSSPGLEPTNEQAVFG